MGEMILEWKKKIKNLTQVFNFCDNSSLYAFYSKWWLPTLMFFHTSNSIHVVAYILPVQLSKSLKIKVFPKTHCLAKSVALEINVLLLSFWMISAGEEDFDEETQGGADRARVTERHPREWYGNLAGSMFH